MLAVRSPLHFASTQGTDVKLTKNETKMKRNEHDCDHYHDNDHGYDHDHDHDNDQDHAVSDALQRPKVAALQQL